VDVVLVVLSNGGGQIFAMLDQASLPELEDLFVTQHPASIADLCAAAAVAHRSIERATDLQPHLERALREGGVQVVEVPIDPALDRDRRAELRAIVRDALARR